MVCNLSLTPTLFSPSPQLLLSRTLSHLFSPQRFLSPFSHVAALSLSPFLHKILRSKIYQNTYWQEQCFVLTAETLVDKAMELGHLGGTIVIEFIKNDDYKMKMKMKFSCTRMLLGLCLIVHKVEDRTERENL